MHIEGQSVKNTGHEGQSSSEPRALTRVCSLVIQQELYLVGSTGAHQGHLIFFRIFKVILEKFCAFYLILYHIKRFSHLFCF